MRGEASLLPLFTNPTFAARFSSLGMLVVMVIGGVSVGLNLNEVRDLLAASSGGQVTPGSRISHLLTSRGLLGVYLGAVAFTATFFMLWLLQVRANLRAFGARRMSYGREWTLLAFLTPGLNLVRPYQVVAEIWQASQPQTLDPKGWRNVPVSPLVSSWWITCLSVLLLHLLAFALSYKSGLSLYRLLAVSVFNILAYGASTVAAGLSLFLVNRLTDAQFIKFDLFESQPPQGQPPVEAIRQD